MLDFISQNGIYILAGLVVLFVIITFLLSRKPEKSKPSPMKEPSAPVNREPEQPKPEEPKPIEKVEEAKKVEPEPVKLEPTPEVKVIEPEQPVVVEKTPEVEPVVEKAKVVEPEVKPEPKKAKPKAEPKKETVVAKPEPVAKPEEIDEDADEEAALKRIVKNPKYHISMNKDESSPYFKKWRVRKEGSTKTIKYFDTQKLAIEYAEDLAEKAKTGVVIHKVDGTIRKQDYSKK